MKGVGVLLLFFIGAVSSVRAACFDHAALDGILKANVDQEGFVDYESIRAKKGGDLSLYLSALEGANVGSCTEDEKLAFWINAYNAHMIQKVLDRPELKKVSEDFKLFDEKVRVASVPVSLNEIEHRIIRADNKKGRVIPGVSLKDLDPRIHFALVCAAIDCPKLINRAYEAATIDRQLQANAVHFANSPKHLRIEEGKLVASSLLKWYGEDFKKWGGAGPYLASLTDPAKRSDEKEVDEKLTTVFPDKTDFRYDWTLNDVRNKTRR